MFRFMKKILTMLLVIELLSAASHPIFAQTAEEWFDKGRSTNDFNLQIEYYTQAIEHGYSPLAHAYSNRGVAKRKLGQYQSAILDFDKAIQLDPSAALAYNSRGNAKMDLGQYQSAILDFDKAIQLKPDYLNAYDMRGYAKFNLKQYQAAILDYDKVIQLKPDYADAYYNRGYTKGFLQQYQSAILDFDKTLELDPDFANAYYYRGLAKSKLKQEELAILDYDKAIKLKPNDAESYNNRGWTKYSLGQYQSAILDFDKAIQLNPEHEKAMTNRLDAIAKLADSDKTPPTITVTDPPINARGLGVSELLATQIPLRGTVTDASGIQTFQINSKSIPLERSGDFTTTINLREGDNEFVLQATDAKGNTAEKKIILHRALPPVIEPKPVVKTPEKRLAFVLANSKYLNINALGDCPYHDAEDMTAALQRLGFEVITFKDLTLEGFEEKIAAFVERLKNYEIGLFFYAGHGLGIDGINYLVPVGFPRRPSKADVRHKCVSLDWIQEKMAEAGAEGKTNIVIADACRDDGGLRNIRGGEPTWEPARKIPTGFITCYAVPNGKTTVNCNGRNGFYTSVLLQHLEKPKLLLQQVFTLVRADIIRQGGQAPEEADKLTKFIYLKSN
jgi:tetratricopeptide (TPR) repeat protein